MQVFSEIEVVNLYEMRVRRVKSTNLPTTSTTITTNTATVGGISHFMLIQNRHFSNKEVIFPLSVTYLGKCNASPKLTLTVKFSSYRKIILMQFLHYTILSRMYPLHQERNPCT